MDARKYASKYIKPDHVRDGPIRHDRQCVRRRALRPPRCSNSKPARSFALNDGNTNTLIKAWGHNTDDWIGQEIELFSAPTRIGATIRRRKKKP